MALPRSSAGMIHAAPRRMIRTQRRYPRSRLQKDQPPCFVSGWESWEHHVELNVESGIFEWVVPNSSSPLNADSFPRQHAVKSTSHSGSTAASGTSVIFT